LKLSRDLTAVRPRLVVEVFSERKSGVGHAVLIDSVHALCIGAVCLLPTYRLRAMADEKAPSTVPHLIR
jgi:hypothetical protein